MFSISRIFRTLPSFLLIIGLVSFTILNAGDMRLEHVHFPKGEIGTTIHDHIKGYQYVDYKLRARAGQRMIVGLKTDNLSNYFNVLAPGENALAFFIGSNEGNHFEGDLPQSGDYIIRVYLMRNAAGRNEKARYSLEIGIAAAGDVPSEANDGIPKKHVNNNLPAVKTSFNATGNIPCARYSGQPMTSCKFGVIRRGGGSATIKVFWPDGGERYLYFENGKIISTDSQSGANITNERDSDLNRIFNGSNERFEIPDAVIYGG